MGKKIIKDKAILLFNDLISLGGIQQYNHFLGSALKAEFPQIDFKVVSLRRSLKLKRRQREKIKFILNTVFAVWHHKPKILICSHINLSPLALGIKCFFGVDYVVLTHGTEIWELQRGIRFLGLKKAKLVLTVSRYSRDKLIAGRISRSKIKLLLNSVDTKFFSPKNKNKALEGSLGLNSKKVLLTVGRMTSIEKYKGHDIVLEVLQCLGDDYVWLVVGEGDDTLRLKKRAFSMGVAERVRFLGKVAINYLVDCYNLCDVFIMPSKGEGFGIVFLEALACGKPVIAGGSDGSREPLLDGEIGFLVDPQSRQEIIKAIDIIFKGEDQRSDPDYLRRKVKENFSLEDFYKKTKEIFSEILL